MKTVFVHPERCIGCKQCEPACAVAHSQTKNLFLAVFESPAPKARIHAEPGLAMNTSFPNKCRHCNPAPCMGVCPTAAIHRAADFPDIVMINANKCIACGMCAMVCPFDVITYHPLALAPERQTVAVKCDNCIERQRLGVVPACVEACKVGALEFGEINELVKAARSRYSEALSVAVGQVSPQVTALPANVEAWRGYGAAVSHLNANGKKGA
ncbi:MAG TPA: 4Fe-4S dicluster domain-containing protein [Anaerolineales bacterium]|nr:4Fe-4S dicluster domain-containing protein [Anaerolineales bacterium]